MTKAYTNAEDDINSVQDEGFWIGNISEGLVVTCPPEVIASVDLSKLLW